jgi:hypothetical protein
VRTSGKRNASNSKNYATTPATKKNASADGRKLMYIRGTLANVKEV